jgi:hypothetical protein
VDPVGLETNIGNTVSTLPYIFTADETGLHVYYPWQQVVGAIFQSMIDTILDGIVAGATEVLNNPTLLDFGDMHVTMQWVKAAAANSSETSDGNMKAPLVRGMPYSTHIYEQLTPQFHTQKGKWLTSFKVDGVEQIDACASNVNRSTSTTHNVLSGSEVELQFLAMSDQTWLFFFYPPLQFTCATNNPADGDDSMFPFGFQLQAIDRYDGVARMALANNCSTGTKVQHCPLFLAPNTPHAMDQTSYKALLRKHAAVYPIAANATGYTVPGAPTDTKGAEDVTHLRFDYHHVDLAADAEATTTGEAPLLMMSLPHHREAMTPETKGALYTQTNGGTYAQGQHACLNGMLQPITVKSTTADASTPGEPPADAMVGIDGGETFNEVDYEATVDTDDDAEAHGALVEWQMELKIPQIRWRSPEGIAPEMKEGVREALMSPSPTGAPPDSEYKPEANYQTGTGDTYFGGKMLGRMARLVLIADELGEVETRDRMVKELGGFVEAWLTPGGDQLIYDERYGGVVSCGCTYDDCNQQVREAPRHIFLLLYFLVSRFLAHARSLSPASSRPVCSLPSPPRPFAPSPPPPFLVQRPLHQQRACPDCRSGHVPRPERRGC